MKEVEIRSGDDIKRLDQKLTYWIDRSIQKGEYGRKFNFTLRDNTFWDNSEEIVNNQWREKSYWHVLPCWKYTIKLKKYFTGVYDLPVYVRLSQELDAFIKNKKLLKKQYDVLISHKPQTLKTAKQEAKEKITSCGNYINDFWRSQTKWFIRYVDNKSEDINHYQYDEYTEDRIESLGVAEDTFYGSMLGNEYAIQWNLIEILNDRKALEYQKEMTRLIRITKKYLALQIALKHYKYPGYKKFTEEHKKWYKDELICELMKIDRSNQKVNDLFIAKVSSLKHGFDLNYFRGGFSKNAFAKAFSEIFEYQFEKSISFRQLKKTKRLGKELEALEKKFK